MNQAFNIFKSARNALMLDLPTVTSGVGNTGPTGCSFISGTGNPTGVCHICDTYIDLNNGDVFQCILDPLTPGVGTWTGPAGESLKGPTGPAGTGPFSNGAPAYGTMWVMGHHPAISSISPNPIFNAGTWPSFTGSNQGPISPATVSAEWWPGTGPNGAPLVGMSVNPGRDGMIIQQDGVYALWASVSMEAQNLGGQNTEIEIGFFRNGLAIGLWSSEQVTSGEDGIDFSYNNSQLCTLETGDIIELYFASTNPGGVTLNVDNIMVTILRIA
jgi:hypothetical protein